MDDRSFQGTAHSKIHHESFQSQMDYARNGSMIDNYEAPTDQDDEPSMLRQLLLIGKEGGLNSESMQGVGPTNMSENCMVENPAQAPNMSHGSVVENPGQQESLLNQEGFYRALEQLDDQMLENAYSASLCG